MNKKILAVAEAVSNEKSLSKKIVFKILENALNIVIKKKYKKKINIRIYINKKNGKFYIYRKLMVVKKVIKPNKEINLNKAINKKKNIKLGEFIKDKIKKINFDRITTQKVKKIIIQKIKEAKKIINFNKIIKKKGKIITGIIKKINTKYILIDIGNDLEAKILNKNLFQKKKFKIGKKIKGLIYFIDKKYNNNYKILIERSNINFLIELLKIEIPEIKNKIIKIKSISRKPGIRSKIAVESKNKKIDPIGACVGIKGLRIKAISNELLGEKIDIILWNKNIKKFLINIMNPIKIFNFKINKIKKCININVKIKNLAQIIGKKGLNIKLSSKLIGLEINVSSKNN